MTELFENMRITNIKSHKVFITNIRKSYNERYNSSLAENSKTAQEKSATLFFEQDSQKCDCTNHQYVIKAAYVVLGINTDGRKDILGIWISQHESAKFWAGALNDLKSRGAKDVYLFCV